MLSTILKSLYRLEPFILTKALCSGYHEYHTRFTDDKVEVQVNEQSTKCVQSVADRGLYPKLTPDLESRLGNTHHPSLPPSASVYLFLTSL